MARSLRIALWNANGLQTKKHEVEVFLNLNNVDILLVAETHYTTRTHIKIPHYLIYHTEHPDDTARGGAAIIIKDTVIHHELPQYQENYLQAAMITVNKLPSPFTLAAVYCQPRHKITKAVCCSRCCFDSLGQIFIVGGDFNAKRTCWGSRLITAKGRELIKLITGNNYTLFSTSTLTY